MKVNEQFEISTYSGIVVRKDIVLNSINRLSIAFPKMSKEFFVLLSEYIIKERFTEERLNDAVDNVIMNFQYKELNISDVIRFDKRIKLYTGNDVCRLAGMFPSPDYQLYDKERRLYAKITDL